MLKFNAVGNAAAGLVAESKIQLPVDQLLQQNMSAALLNVDRNFRIRTAQSGQHAAKINALQAGDYAHIQSAPAQTGV